MRDQVIPRTKQCRGARRLYLLHSTSSNNDFVVLTLWNSKEDADGYAKSDPYTQNSKELMPLLVSDPNLTEFVIELHDVNTQDLPPPETAKAEAKKELKQREKSRSSKKTTAKRKKSSSRKRSR